MTQTNDDRYAQPTPETNKQFFNLISRRAKEEQEKPQKSRFNVANEDEAAYVQLCAFTAAGKYAGSCLRVDSSMIISKDSDCMALRFVYDNDILSQYQPEPVLLKSLSQVYSSHCTAMRGFFVWEIEKLCVVCLRRIVNI